MGTPPQLRRAYWNTAPFEFLTATGAVVARWGWFEQIFEGFAIVLSRPPHLQEQARTVPISFQRKSALIMSLAEQALGRSPSLIDKIREFHISANKLSRKRNILTHGIWFDHRHFDTLTHYGVTIQEKADGSRGFYSVELEDIEALSTDIEQLMLLGIDLHWNPTTEVSSILTPDELSALRQYHKDYPPIPEAEPRYRGPRGKGNVPRPKLFRDLP